MKKAFALVLVALFVGLADPTQAATSTFHPNPSRGPTSRPSLNPIPGNYLWIQTARGWENQGKINSWSWVVNTTRGSTEDPAGRWLSSARRLSHNIQSTNSSHAVFTMESGEQIFVKSNFKIKTQR